MVVRHGGVRVVGGKLSSFALQRVSAGPAAIVITRTSLIQ